MKPGTIVILIDSEGGSMPPLGTYGEIVGREPDGDYQVEFPYRPCPAGPGTWFACEGRWLLPIGDRGKWVADIINEALRVIGS